ncbi:SIR2 family protein [uncultured Abiotrophia sp.]|uniref:SIR2 family protein n=1 Tax=uncultured Abiotrophia sp. TaxID=316094 RepID=UPI0028EFA923|nr:SIR2 family protein [uncultured Abiotrophia sp.]
MNNVITKNELIGIIEQALYNDELAIFAGAGLSINAGYYNWEKLLEKPAEKLKLDISKEKHDLISLAQFYCNKNKRSAINDLLSNSFPSNKKPTENHKILSQLPISTYWTTNFDTLIEDALKENNKNVSVRKSDKDLQLSYRNYDSVVYKMHGDIQSPSEAVITRDDYEEYGVNSRKLFRDVLEGTLLTKTFLFLGFSFSDPNFNFVLSKMRVLLGDDNRPHYYILKKITKPNREDFDEEEKYTESREEYEYSSIKQKLQIEDLDRYGIRICLIDSYDEITNIFKIVLNRYKRKTIFLSGSAETYDPMDTQVAKDFISKLSFKLIENGYKVVNGYGLGVGTYVISGITEYCYNHRNTKIEDSLKLMPFPLSAINSEKLRKTWEKYREEMISQCGIAIYMFGNKRTDGEIINADGVKKEFDIAKSNQLVNIPLAFTGYMAKQLYFENKNTIENDLDIEGIESIVDFCDIDTNVDKIIKMIDRLNSKENC